MNYTRIYESIITRAKSRTFSGYRESHHILPKCMGGTNDCSNLVDLTAEEHYIAHLLLVKMYPKNRSLWYAANMMSNRNNKHYAWTKKRHAEIVSEDKTGFKHTAEAKKKMKEAVGKRWANNAEGFSQEQKRRATRPKTKKDGYYKPKSDEHSQNISKAALQRPRFPCSICGKLTTKANIKNHMKVHKE